MDNFYFFKEISEHNILTLTGHCNCHCVFCSHGNNPRGTKIYQGGTKDVSLVFTGLDFLDPKKEIIIGESASPISEGEPFLYPYLFDVLFAIRKKFPNTPISITTNGTKLTGTVVAALKEIGGISLWLSLNTLDYRQEMMGDTSDTAIEAPRLLQEAGISFGGSVVMMPELTGWQDIENTVALLHQYGATMVRLLMPGFGGKSNNRYGYHWAERRARGLDVIERQTGITLLEPPFYQNNLPYIYGVIGDSFGEKYGFLKGDLVLSVNGKVPRNRFEAWLLIKKGKKVRILVKRGRGELLLRLEKPKGHSGGLVFENDLDLNRLEKMDKIVIQHGGKPLVCTSKLGYDYIKENQKLFPNLQGLPVVIAENRYFGGNLGAAGLLVMEDFREALKGQSFDYAFLPQEVLNEKGEDLVGETPLDLPFESYFI